MHGQKGDQPRKATSFNVKSMEARAAPGLDDVPCMAKR